MDKTANNLTAAQSGVTEKAHFIVKPVAGTRSGKQFYQLFFLSLKKCHIYKVVGHSLSVNQSVKRLTAASCMLNMLQLHFLHLKQCWEN